MNQVGYTCSNTDSRCTAPIGKVLFESIKVTFGWSELGNLNIIGWNHFVPTSFKVYTSDCVGCTTEGVTVRLLGERNFNYMQGTPCTTNVLDLPGSQEYGSNGSFEFEDRDQLGACFQVA